MSLNSSIPDDPHESASRFHTTHWSVVVAAGQAGTVQSARALEALCKAYWYPLYAYVRRRVTDIDQAQDLTQSFFAECLEKNSVGVADPRRGKFRAFLLTSLKHFLSKEWEKSRTLKRGGGRAALSLDFDRADARYGMEPCSGLTAEQLFDRQWAVTLLELIFERMESEFARSGKAAQFQQLKGFVVGDHAGATYAAAAAGLGISEAAAKMAAHRLRQRYRQLLREEIAHTVSSPEEVDDEIRNLFAVLDS